MLNRRILRIKAFKELYSSKLLGDVPYSNVKANLDASCEAVRDLYIMMLGIISPLTQIAKERTELAQKKFNPTEQELHPNLKFVNNALAPLFDNDPDFKKAFSKRKFDWSRYDLFIRKIHTSLSNSQYFQKYMSAPTTSLSEDCKLFIRIFENEFAFNEDIEHILEEMSIYWNDELDYALTWCCHTLDEIAKGGRWNMPKLYLSDMQLEKKESDRDFVHNLIFYAYNGWETYSELVTKSVNNWESDRIVSTDMALIVLGLAEATNFPTIPVQVTINEYVDIAKLYGTPKSSIFVNGLLDKLVRSMMAEGKIVKINLKK